MADGTRRWADQFKWIHNPNRSNGSAISIGDSSQALPLKTATYPVVNMAITSALTSGTTDVVKIAYTQTAAVTSGYLKGIRCTMTSDVCTPGSFNAIKGIIDYVDTGYAHGDCAPMSSELLMNTGNHTRGSYTCYEAQIQVGASTTWNSAGPCSFFRCKINGTKAHFDTYGCLFDFQGVTEGSNLFIDSDGSPTATGGIRCNLGAGYIWLLYRDTAPA